MTLKYFITGTGTGVGKTLITCSLASQLRAQGKRISALKPIISGYQPHDPASDTAQILKSQNLPLTAPNEAAISPWRFKAALAPSMAAAKEGKKISFPDVAQFCGMQRISEITLIEGAGGVMVPIDKEHTILDLISVLHAPAILVAGTYLGAISHTLTAGYALLSRGIKLQAVVVSESEDGAMSARDTAHALKPMMPYSKFMVALPRVAGEGELWQHTADMTWMLK